MRRQPWETNRDVKRKPKRGKLWCPKCDHYLMNEGAKCKYCRTRMKIKRNKKE